MNNIILAGSNGFIGTFLYDTLNKNNSINALDYSQGLIEDNFSSLDLTQENDVDKYVEKLQKCDALIFLVGLAHKKGKVQDLDEFRCINKQTLINLVSKLDNSNKLPEKIIFSSTISVYGEKINQAKYPEDSLKNPSSPYAVTKLEAEEYLLDSYRLQSWILRFAPVYSPDFQLNINRRTRAGGIYYKVGDGSKKLSLCNLENIGLVVNSILEDHVPPGIYNISDSIDYTYNDLLRYVKAKWIIPIPIFLVKTFFFIGKMINNLFLIENTIKLISDNIFPSNKLSQHIRLPSVLFKHKKC